VPTLHLVRHGVALDREGWSGDDRSRPLTDFGWRQSLAIAAATAEQEIQLFWTSPTVRCADTLLPAAHSRGLEVRASDLLFESNEPSGPQQAEEMLREIAATCMPAGVEVAAAATHGNILVPLLSWASGQGLLRCPKGGLWRLELSRQLAPRSVEYQGCLDPKTKGWTR
jgi:phosphohistidine phosphatase SixA